MQEIIEWLAKPENLQADSLPPFVENFDVAPYLVSALPIAGGVLGINLLHELVQRSVAASKQARPPTTSNTVLPLSSRQHICGTCMLDCLQCCYQR